MRSVSGRSDTMKDARLGPQKDICEWAFIKATPLRASASRLPLYTGFLPTSGEPYVFMSGLKSSAMSIRTLGGVLLVGRNVVGGVGENDVGGVGALVA